MQSPIDFKGLMCAKNTTTNLTYEIVTVRARACEFALYNSRMAKPIGSKLRMFIRWD
jgi:hypothetical protein